VSAGAWIAVALLGGLMALARFGLDAFLSDHPVEPFPLGIFAVNVIGTFAAGVIAGAALGHEARTILAGGITGSFTTFSTWMLDGERLAEAGRPRLVAINLAGSMAAGIAAVCLGHALGTAV